MKLFSVHAYAVLPQRKVSDRVPCEGGAIKIDSELRSLVEEMIRAASFETKTLVDFHIDTSSRTRKNEIRELIMQYAFDPPSSAKAATRLLAERLSTSMDRRSTECLFVTAGRRDAENRREVTLWTFPRDDAIQLIRRTSAPTIQILHDVFSKTSRLRKAALFSGKLIRTDFLSGNVLDYQAKLTTQKSAADFWIQRFLQCRFGILGDSGTRLLATTLRKAHEECGDHLEDQEQLYVAAMSMRRSPHKTLSLSDFGRRYLEGGALEAFMKAVPNDESATTPFEFQRKTFEAAINYRIFQLDTGVFVSSPFTEIDKSVHISEGRDKRLVCEGNVVNEKFRARQA